MFKSSTFLIFLVVSGTNCQFFYNYEEDRPEDSQSEVQSYDQSPYQYNPPSTVNQQYLQQPSSENQPINETGNRRTRIRVRSRNYQSDAKLNEPQSDSVVNPSIDQTAVIQERRQARRRQRQNDYIIEPIAPPRVYGPSIFENIGLGEAPSGVYIPSDSFLNVLRNQRLISAIPETPIDNKNSGLRSPSNEEPRQPNLILPVTKPAIDYANAPLPQPNTVAVRNSPAVQTRIVRGNRRSRPRIRMQPEYAAPPTIDIDALREYSDDFIREDVMPQVHYVPVTARQNSRPQNRRRTVTNYHNTTPAPRVYSPSIFENVGLGEAPNGIYVPEDSLLNVLRNPLRQHSSHRQSRRKQPSQSSYSIPNEYGVEVIEDQYESPPAPPPPKSRSPQRSRQVISSGRPQNQDYANEYENYQNIQPSSHQRNQRSGGDTEDFERQKPPVRHRTQSPQRTQTQSSSVEMSQSMFRKAKLAIAELPRDTDEDDIPGEAGVNYPTLHVIPKTSFSCAQQPHNGYYADLETSCQVVHLCQSGGVQDSFLCPNGTIFSQEKFSCQWWYKVNCNDAPKYYVKNDELYKAPEKKERKRN